MSTADSTSRAAVVHRCRDAVETAAFFVNELGFVSEALWPADAPEVVVVAGYGLRLRLVSNDAGPDPTGSLPTAQESGRIELVIETDLDPVPIAGTTPDGVTVTFVELPPHRIRESDLPPLDQQLVITRPGDDSAGAWGVGRAGMRYRDLVPDREGGRFIASHIHIPTGGPVPDQVHYHHIRFQLIFVRSGWVRVVYEDQGEPFVMQQGDAVLQPPLIRHQVLESSDDLEVIEIGCPAEHRTAFDHDLSLPTQVTDPGRDFQGQRFCHHVAANASWLPWEQQGMTYRDTGIGAATDGLASVVVVRGGPSKRVKALEAHTLELRFLFVLNGTASIAFEDETVVLEDGDAACIPAGVLHQLSVPDQESELLLVELPGQPMPGSKVIA